MLMRYLLSAALAVGLCALAASAKRYPYRRVAIAAQVNFDVRSHLGLWSEIARFPNWFEAVCEGLTAEFALRDYGKISVTNTCLEEAPNEPVRTVDGVGGSRLRCSSGSVSPCLCCRLPGETTSAFRG